MYCVKEKCIKILVYAIILCLTNNTWAQNKSYKKSRTVIAGDNAFNNLKFYTAASLFEKSVQENSSNYYAAGKLGDCYWKVKDFNKALRWYQKLDSVWADSLNFVLQYIDVLKANGKYDYAIDYCKLYSLKHPENEIIKTKSKELERLYLFYKDSAAYKIEFLNINSNYRDFSPIQFNKSFAFVSNRPDGLSFLNRSSDYPSGDSRDEEFSKLYFIADTAAIFSTADRVTNTAPLLLLKKSNRNVGPITFSSDGKTVYYTVNVKPKKNISGLGIMKATYVNGKIIDAKPFDFNEDFYATEHPALSQDGNYLYFTSNKPGGNGGFDIYCCKKDSNAQWAKPVNLGQLVNTEGNEVFPFVDREGNLYFSSDKLLGLGALDIFFVKMKDGMPIESPRNLGYPINSSSDDFGIITDSSSSVGYFSSNRRGGDDDIYRFKKMFSDKIIKGVVIADGCKKIISCTKSSKYQKRKTD